MRRREQPRVAPVGLQRGDRFKTPWGPLEIEAVRREQDEYDVHDPNTGERTTLSHGALLDVMQANVYSTRFRDLEDDI